LSGYEFPSEPLEAPLWELVVVVALLVELLLSSLSSTSFELLFSVIRPPRCWLFRGSLEQHAGVQGHQVVWPTAVAPGVDCFSEDNWSITSAAFGVDRFSEDNWSITSAAFGRACSSEDNWSIAAAAVGHRSSVLFRG
jgi:hypothetical protein